MKFCLINCRYYHKKFNENLSIVDEKFGIYTPLSLCYIASIIENSGHDVIIIDAKAENLSNKELLKRVKKYNPNLLGFSFHSAYNVHDTLDVINYLKKETKIPILAGGYNFNLYPNEHMVHKEIDYAISGNVIETLPTFLEVYPNIEKLKEINGIYINKNNLNYKNPLKKINIPLDKLPFPSRKDLKHAKYSQFISKRKNFTIMLTHTGCPYMCTFCTIPNSNFSMRSISQVIEEIKECYYKYNVREIDFFDAVFTVSRKRTIELCDSLIKLNLDLSWSCRTRIDKVDQELVDLMYKSGCRRIYYGVESVDNKILSKIKKGIHKPEIQKVIEQTKKSGILTLGFFMIGNPGETKKTIRSTIEFSKELDLDYVQYSMTIAKPDTLLEKELIKKTKKDYWRNYILGLEKERPLNRIWTRLSNKEIEKMTRKAYLEFYFRPKIILKHIFKIRSFSELRKYLIVSIRMFLDKEQ